MGAKLYVGNLSWSANEEDLRDLFSQHSLETQEVKLITDRETGRSRGFAFVTLSKSDEAQKAITALNGQNFQGRPLTVNEAREREGGGGGGGGGGFRGGRGGGGGGGGRGGRDFDRG